MTGNNQPASVCYIIVPLLWLLTNTWFENWLSADISATVPIVTGLVKYDIGIGKSANFYIFYSTHSESGNCSAFFSLLLFAMTQILLMKLWRKEGLTFQNNEQLWKGRIEQSPLGT